LRVPGRAMCAAKSTTGSASSIPSARRAALLSIGRKVETSTRLIKNATSLGGVDSTMESRYRWEGDRVPEGLLRLSVGLEDVEELWADLEQALNQPVG